jgi:AcrR family transcriptional regulator
MSPETLESTEPDGRTLRRVRSYDQAIDAVLDLIGEGVESPTAQQVADRSGISIRTVFRLTEDVESLHAAAVQRQIERLTPHFTPISPVGPLSPRVAALVENRATLFETIGPVRRVAERLAATSTEIAEPMERGRQLLRAQMSNVFRSELALISGTARRDVLNAIDVTASWEVWDQLRRARGLSRKDSERTVRRLLEGVLTSRSVPGE